MRSWFKIWLALPFVAVVVHAEPARAADAKTLDALDACTYPEADERQVVGACSEVIRHIEAVATSDSARESAFDELSRQYFADGREREPTEVELVTGEAFYPRAFAELYRWRGLALVRVGMCDLALPDFDTTLRMTPNTSPYAGQLHTDRGKALNCLKRYDEAKASLDTAITLDPKSSQGYLHRAEAHIGKSAYQEAIKDLDQSIAIYGKDDEAYRSRAHAHAMLGRTDKAIADATKAIEIKKSSENYEERGEYYLDAEKYDLAIADYTKAIELNSKNWLAYSGRAEAYEEKGDMARAAADQKKADELTGGPGASKPKR